MLLPELVFGSYLSYAPRGESAEARRAKTRMREIKDDKVITPANKTCSEHLVETILSELNMLPFKNFFRKDIYLVPVPKSSLMKLGTLWVPLRIAEAFESKGLGKVMNCLYRKEAVLKSATSQASERPKAQQHYDTLAVKMSIHQPQKIVLVDDIVTRGATFLGCASLLKIVFPKALIVGFAMMRTVSEEINFQQMIDPCTGNIALRKNGDTHREP